jgi:hypothetical protein
MGRGASALSRPARTGACRTRPGHESDRATNAAADGRGRTHADVTEAHTLTAEQDTRHRGRCGSPSPAGHYHLELSGY